MQPIDDVDLFLAQGCLVVDFVGELYVVGPSEILTFGRDADLQIDDNEFLHRKLGRFQQRHNLWWLTNIGNRIELDIFDRATQATARLPSGTGMALASPDLLVSFTAGRTRYEIQVHSPTSITVQPATPSDTANPQPLPWTIEQRLLMAVLAESLLRNPHLPLVLPTNDEARARLGWEKAKFNRKLDAICDRLTAIGVRGVERGQERRNTERRRVLAELAVTHKVVTGADLELIARFCPASTEP